VQKTQSINRQKNANSEGQAGPWYGRYLKVECNELRHDVGGQNQKEVKAKYSPSREEPVRVAQ
jgi:hypothetical protein